MQALMPKIACRDGAEFYLYQYDQALHILHGEGIVDKREREIWEWAEPRLTRAIKYLVERICMEASTARPVLEAGEPAFAAELALICAESMVDLAHESELVHSVFPVDCVVRIFTSGPPDFNIAIEGAHAGYDRVFSDRVIRDRESRKQFVGFPQFDNHTATHQDYLDAAFSHSFGMSYGEFIAAIIAVIDGCLPAPNYFPTLFVDRRGVINELAKSGRDRPAIERAIDGFSISAESLIAEGRMVWKPKQENRAYRRGFYVFPHENGPHLAFSRAMARENLCQLVNWVCYKRLPVEWETAATRRALDNLARAGSKWFEDTVCRNLNTLGVVGRRVRRTVGSPQRLLRIPVPVGEIDFLGYHSHQKLLVLVESKMVMTGLEARYWRDDIDEFVLRRGSYAERFRRKIAWVVENRDAISAVFGLGPVVGVGAAMLTLYPCIARAFIPDFPCVSLTEFMLDYECKSGWPYPLACARSDRIGVARLL